jgi:hypothetical protein
MMGYLEGEFIALDEDLAERPFDPAVKAPFKIEKTCLPAGCFRESEVHVVLNRDKSHPQMLQSLLEMGPLHCLHDEGTAQIFTV